MKVLFVEIVVAFIVFLGFKFIMVMGFRLADKIFGIKEQNHGRFDLLISIAIHILFLLIWMACIDSAVKTFKMSDLEFYISFCLIGFFSVIWCYFSWDAEHFFVKPHVASEEAQRAKKIILYLLILVFVMCQGYQQTLHLANNSYEVNILFSMTNYSIIVGAIALDRVMNQIINK